MPAKINKIEVEISCQECDNSIVLDGIQKMEWIQQHGVNSWTYIDVIDFPLNWKRYGEPCFGLTKQEFYCPLHDKSKPKKIGRPKKKL